MVWLLASCHHEERTVINGRILNLEHPYIIASYLSSDTIAIDSIDVDEKGRFSYSCPIDSLTTFSLYLNNYETAVPVFADKNQKLKVRGDALLPDLIEVNGNEINNDLTLFKKENSDLLTQRGQLLVNLHKSVELDTGRNHLITRHDEFSKLNVLNRELTLKAEEFIKENPAKQASLILINNFFTNSDSPQALERVLGELQGEITETPFAVRLKSYSERINRSAEGATMPYFKLVDNDGEELHSYDFTGKYLLLSFISMAGTESRETVEMLKSEYEQVDKDSVAFITLYIDSDIYPADYADSDSIPWIVVPEKRSWGSDIVEAYNVQHIPFNILIAPDGNIQIRNIPAQGVMEVIDNAVEDSM